jgi:hypothetical protein
MSNTGEARSAIVIPVGPGKECVLDTLEGVASFCAEEHLVVIVDDHTEDGTYEALTSVKRANWRILRNPRQMGRIRLVHSLCSAYRLVLSDTNCGLVLRLDQDALIIKSGVLSDAQVYSSANPTVGLFGVYEQDYDRPRSFDAHRRLIQREMSLIPYPAKELVESPYKVVHSVDKGKNTDRESNGGMTAREYFRAVRRQDQTLAQNPNS